jgi:hypothetical protein
MVAASSSVAAWFADTLGVSTGRRDPRELSLHAYARAAAVEDLGALSEPPE